MFLNKSFFSLGTLGTNLHANKNVFDFDIHRTSTVKTTYTVAEMNNFLHFMINYWTGKNQLCIFLNSKLNVTFRKTMRSLTAIALSNQTFS